MGCPGVQLPWTIRSLPPNSCPLLYHRWLAAHPDHPSWLIFMRAMCKVQLTFFMEHSWNQWVNEDIKLNGRWKKSEQTGRGTGLGGWEEGLWLGAHSRVPSTPQGLMKRLWTVPGEGALPTWRSFLEWQTINAFGIYLNVFFCFHGRFGDLFNVRFQNKSFFFLSFLSLQLFFVKLRQQEMKLVDYLKAWGGK